MSHFESLMIEAGAELLTGSLESYYGLGPWVLQSLGNEGPDQLMVAHHLPSDATYEVPMIGSLSELTMLTLSV